MSVRRPARATAASDAGDIPSACATAGQRWVTPDEKPPDWWWGGTAINADDPVGETMSWLSVIAWTRWTEARIAWAKDHGLSWSESCAAYSDRPDPRWRDWYAFRSSLTGLDT